MYWTCLTRREKHRCLGLSIVITSFVVCSVLVYTGLKYIGNGSRRSSPISDMLMVEECIPTCFTKECVIQANLMNKNMDPSFDQCEDFFSFSCANFDTEFSKEDNFSNALVYGKRIFMEIKDLLDNMEADPETASGKMKIVYDSCIDTRSSELDAVTSTLEFFGAPNWPNLPADFKFSKPISTVLGTLFAYGETNFFEIGNRQVDGNYSFDALVKPAMFSDGGGVLIPNREARILKYFNLDMEELIASVKKYFYPMSTLKKRNKICKKMTDFYLNCSQDVPQQWRMLCEIVDVFVDVANLSHKISKTDIFIPCLDVSMVEMSLNLTSEAPHKILTDMFMLWFYVKHLDDLSFYFRLIRKDDRSPEINPYADRIKLNHWEHCVEWLTKNMIHALSHVYIKNILSQQALVEIQDIVEECAQEINNLIRSQKWLTKKEKARILTKLDKPVSTKLMLKYHLNETYINNYYNQFHPTQESFIKNVLEFQRSQFSRDKALKSDFLLLNDNTPFMVNAYNREGVVEIGFGYLKFPAFIVNEPRILNLIRIAFSLGHELGHVIDSAFNELAETNSSTKATLKERISCIYNQYSNFTIESLEEEVDALQTAGENHADTVAVALIDKLIKKYDIDEATYSLPSLPYSTKDLIYIIYAVLSCEKNSKEMDRFKYELDTHAQERFRVTGVMQNSESFSRTFNCSDGSYMNMKPKCSLLDLE